MRLMTSALPTDRPDGLSSPSAVEDAGVRDARAIVARVEADEAAAREAREQYRRDGIPAIEADDVVARHLHGGERVYARRSSTTIEGQGADGDAIEAAAGASLYLTSTRLLHLGRRIVSLELEDIEELAIVGDRLLVTMHDGSGCAIGVSEPHLLRAQTAAVRAERRQP